MNLLKKTIDILNEHDLTLNDIIWWGNPHFNEKYPLNMLESLLDFEYNNGYGLPNINEDLVIVGHDWWLERFEYDGAEWWEFKRQFKEPSRTVSDPNKIKRHIIN
ncbi:MAG: hypothetical protein E6618_14835 [Staphylococcus warneri]|jgi:hypothetical protein|nr:hypothetical protein [Staphylococcus warneri]